MPRHSHTFLAIHAMPCTVHPATQVFTLGCTHAQVQRKRLKRLSASKPVAVPTDDEPGSVEDEEEDNRDRAHGAASHAGRRKTAKQPNAGAAERAGTFNLGCPKCRWSIGGCGKCRSTLACLDCKRRQRNKRVCRQILQHTAPDWRLESAPAPYQQLGYQQRSHVARPAPSTEVNIGSKTSATETAAEPVAPVPDVCDFCGGHGHTSAVCAKRSKFLPLATRLDQPRGTKNDDRDDGHGSDQSEDLAIGRKKTANQADSAAAAERAGAHKPGCPKCRWSMGGCGKCRSNSLDT